MVDEKRKAPWHLWVTGGVSLLWNGFGGYDYVQTKLKSPEYLQPMAEAVGVSLETVTSYYALYPLWANIAWALGVWCSVAGSILLLLRSRHAGPAFLASLVGLAGGTVQQVAHPMPGVTDMTVPYVFTAVISFILVALLVYAQRMAKTGVLR